MGERLARYDVEKQCAIEKRDYELAKRKKELMEDYRRSVYQQLEVYNLLDTAMVSCKLRLQIKMEDRLHSKKTHFFCSRKDIYIFIIMIDSRNEQAAV